MVEMSKRSWEERLELAILTVGVELDQWVAGEQDPVRALRRIRALIDPLVREDLAKNGLSLRK